MQNLKSPNTIYVSSEDKVRALSAEAKNALQNNKDAMNLVDALFKKCGQLGVFKPLRVFCKEELRALDEDQDFLVRAGAEALIYRTIFRLGLAEFKEHLKKVSLSNGTVLDQEAIQLLLDEARVKKESFKLKLPENQALLKYVIKIQDQTPEAFTVDVTYKKKTAKKGSKKTTISIPKTEAFEHEGYIVALSDKFAQKYGCIKEFKRPQRSFQAQQERKKRREKLQPKVQVDYEEREQEYLDFEEQFWLEQERKKAELKQKFDAELIKVNEYFPEAFLTVVPYLKDPLDIKFNNFEGGFIKVVATSQVKASDEYLSLTEIYELGAVYFANFLYLPNAKLKIAVRYVYAVKEET